MPFDGCSYYNIDEGKRIRAWAAHYHRKGCTLTKADDVARRKCQRSHTWPPQH